MYEFDMDCEGMPGTAFEITASAEPAEGGVISGAGTYGYGSTCTLMATANEGYTFMYWTENGVQVSTSAWYSFNVTSDRELVAHFTLPFAVTATANPTEGGTVGGAGSYVYGSTCTMTATPNEGYTFMYWTEDSTRVSFDSGYTFRVTEDRSLEAHFVEEGLMCDLVVYLYDSYGDGWNGNKLVVNYGNGVYEEITLNGGSSGMQTLWVENGSHVTLTWIAGQYIEECSYVVCYSNGNVIYHGENINSEFMYEFDMNCDEGLTFEITASANPTEWGSVTGVGLFNYGTTCILTATAYDDYEFHNWTENGDVVSTDVSYSFTVTDNRNLVANFGVLTPHWTVSDSYQNNMFMVGVVQIDGVEQASPVLELGAFCNGECRGAVFPEYEDGQWLYFMTIGGNSGDEITFRLYDHSLQQELNLYCFNVIPFEIYGLIGIEEPYEVQFASLFTISANVSPEDSGTITGAGEYLLGTEAILTAIATSGYLFNSWTLDGEIVSTEPSYSFTVTEPVSLTANFDVLHSVSATVNLENAGTIVGTGIYVLGTNATLIASPNEGYAFNNWTLDGEIVSTEPSYTFMVTESVNLTANFDVIRTQQLAEGWNWWSTNLEITLDQLKSALVEALPGTIITIKSRTQNTAYNPSTSRWRGTLTSLDMAQMYMIEVGTDCEITLTGIPVNPTEHPITIHNGSNWIAFPFNENMLVNDALAGFPAVNGDIIKSRMNNAIYIRGAWRGAVTTLEPGQGYIFISNAQEDRTLIFGTNNSK